MKNIIKQLFLVVLLIILSVSTVQASPGDAVLFLKYDNQTTLVGNEANLNLVVNSMGEKIDFIRAVIVVKGLSDESGASFNMHPDHVPSKFHQSEGFILENYNTQNLGSDSLKVYANFKAKGEWYNEGSAAIPLFQIKYLAPDTQTVSAFISDETVVGYTDTDSFTPFKNYSMMNRPAIQTIANSSPTPTPAPELIEATPLPEKEVDPELEEYRQKFDELDKEFSKLETKVETQENRINILENFMQMISRFFDSLFSR